VRKIGDLTGVSKYFYDLDETLNTKSTNPPLEIISKLATELKTEIGGEFIFENGRLSFVDDSGRSIDKNLKRLDISLIKSDFKLKSIIFFVSKDRLSPSVDRLVSSSSKETSSDMLAIWKFSCNSFFKAIFNSRTYISSPSVKLRIKGVKQLLKKST
jgi:hypothetical protein